MGGRKTKSIIDIERRMEDMDMDMESLRYHVLQNAKSFKTSWIDLGQALYNVWKDKLYKDWGYQEFDSYASKEIGIRKETALKLLRSYSFLEKEEPKYLKKEYNDAAEADVIPSYESVDVLRKANQNKNVGREDYARIKKYVLNDGKDAKEVRKDLTQMIKRNEELDPEDARKKKQEILVKRFISVLRSVSREIRLTKALPAQIAKEADSLIVKIESAMQEEQ